VPDFEQQSMMRFLKYLLLLPIVAAALLVSLGNRQIVTLHIHPFREGEIPDLTLDVPLYLVLLVTLMVGVVIGGFATWLEQGKHRAAARRARAEVKRLTAEAARGMARAAGEKRKLL
jgi:uncharacterized integral membrane protein